MDFNSREREKGKEREREMKKYLWKIKGKQLCEKLWKGSSKGGISPKSMQNFENMETNLDLTESF